MNEIIITGTALESPRIETVTRHGDQVQMSHFYFDFDPDTKFSGVNPMELNIDQDGHFKFRKADALHIINFGKPLDIMPGQRLQITGRLEQGVWTTHEGSKAYKIQDFIAHKMEVIE